MRLESFALPIENLKVLFGIIETFFLLLPYTFAEFIIKSSDRAINIFCTEANLQLKLILIMKRLILFGCDILSLAKGMLIK
ncbi:hypothetical protein T4D_5288 [Trichinella pseudospiralis]|uniref:Uncharacterized protein n=1 Tax=Trichinella pseudospiralis TaxID=6337 RepID=A0A0V1FN84_TRIPS|nr:hypothetical protein T4D_5288 [Trichinella pseudospiralis]